MDKQNIMGSLGDLTVETIPATAPLLLNSLGIIVNPTSVLLVTKMAKFMWKVGLIDVFKDYESNHMSNLQQNKLEDVKTYALKTVYQLMEKEGYDDSHPESASYTHNFIDYSSDLLDKALKEGRQAKRFFLGAYLGSTIYTLNTSLPNWDNVFYLSSLIDRLTLRQIILIKLLTDGFNNIEDHDDLICVTNKVAISELKELASQNMWIGLISYQPDPTYKAIPLKYILPTDLAMELISSTPLPDCINQSINDVIKSLGLQPYSMTGLPDSFMMMIKKKMKMNSYK